jgi:hypothetical protein
VSDVDWKMSRVPEPLAQGLGIHQVALWAIASALPRPRRAAVLLAPWSRR